MGYVVVKEPALAYFRLRRDDAPQVAGLETMWRGDSLRAGYDAMIRLNRDRKFVSWAVCYKEGKFRASKGGPKDETWKTVEICTTRHAAFAALRRWRERWAEERSRVLESMGVDSKRPRMRRGDKSYLMWRLQRDLETAA